jgi:hypothetical protein
MLEHLTFRHSEGHPRVGGFLRTPSSEEPALGKRDPRLSASFRERAPRPAIRRDGIIQPAWSKIAHPAREDL